MDFKSFKKTRNMQSSTSEQSENQTDNIRKTAEEYAKKSDPELLGEILKTASQGKQNGTLDKAQIENFVKRVSPMLNEEQRQRLNGVVEMIAKN